MVHVSCHRSMELQLQHSMPSLVPTGRMSRPLHLGNQRQMSVSSTCS